MFFKKCHKRDDCKTEEEVAEFMKDKYLLLLSNQIRFDSSQYSEESIVPESRLLWLNTSNKSQLEQTFYVKKTYLNSQDLAIDLDQLTELENSEIFKLNRMPQ